MLDTHARRAGGCDTAASVAAYIRDPTLNLYRRVGFGGLSYSDGAEPERRIYETVRRARDRSTYSDELACAIGDWPSEYHLSRQRHCVASVVAFGLGAPSWHQLTHDPISVERLAVFIVCAAIGILVSVPRPSETPSRIR